MVAESIVIKSVRQIVPPSGLWLRYDESREVIGESFLPAVAIAHCEIEPPNRVYFTDSFFMPIASGELMYGGLPEHGPFEGVRFTYSIYRDVDFAEVGFRLQPGARPHSVVGLPEER